MYIINGVILYINNHDGYAPYTLQYIDGFSWSQISNFPKSSTLWCLIHRYIPGAWTEPILITPSPADSGLHNWLLAPVTVHWITGDPPSVLSPAISSTNPLSKLWIIYPFPFWTNIQRWLNLLVCRYWIILVSGWKLHDGTSNAFPELELVNTQDLLRI